LAYAPELVKDVNPDPLSSFFNAAVVWNERAYAGINSSHLWSTDGTEAGTIKLADVFVSPSLTSGVLPRSPTPSGNNLYFAGRDVVAPFRGVELWKTDGTPAGTKVVKDITLGGQSSSPDMFTDVGGTLFFTVQGTQLWKTDGTEAARCLSRR
jgi:ELWxxDGT repeat protein